MSTIDKYTCSEDNNREYQLTFYSPEYYLRLAIFYNTSESESGGVYSYSRVDNTYPSVGTFEDFVKLCCYNCNSVQGERMFKVGTVSESIATDIRVMTFSDYNCLAVLKQSCESFETTWKVRINEDPEPDSVFIIDFGAAIEDFPVTLKVEHAQGLTSIDVTASDKDVYTQFVIKGGSENLPSDYPYPNLQLDEDPSGTPQVLANSMIKLPDLYSRWGKSIKELTYEDIKPSRTGTVTSISENILKFTDSDLIGAAWSPVGGTIHFVSGHLIGFTFNCQDFNSATGEITIESTEENNGFVLPSPTDSYYRINELDKYNIAGVSLPSSYITAAKTALKERALLGIDYWSQPRMQYAITIDPKIISVEIVPNMGFHIEHSALGINKVIKVQQVIYDLSKESPYDIESILISDLKTDDSKADSTHRQVATNRNIVNGTGANNVYSAKLLSRQRILDDYAKSQGLPNWGTFMEILSSGKGLWKDEDGNWWLNVAAIKAGAIGAELIDVTQLIANEVFINGVEDTAENLVNNYLLHLTSQVATVACDSEGTVTGTLPTSTAIVYHGASADTGWSFSGELSGCTGSVNEGTGVITITGLTADDSTVTVSATKADKPTLQATFRISKVYAGVGGADGEDGAASVIYYLTPSVDNVVKSMSGTLTPSSVTCAQYKVVGNAAPVAGDKTIKYQLSGGALTTYTEAVNIGTASYVDFFLYDGEVELWRTRVPVILDASDIEYIYNSFADGDTYVAGGLVLSSFVGVLDGTDAVVAGMAGKDFVLDGETPITSPMFFAGSTTAQNANNAKFRVYQDGSMYAELGEIGGLTIAASKLYLGTGNHNNADT
ncbi:MAG: hypothetical protein PHS38_07880, partial [Bacteroidales bacterium]|nr:hypothetical protein [Bacteroidales bacterium]